MIFVGQVTISTETSAKMKTTHKRVAITPEALKSLDVLTIPSIPKTEEALRLIGALVVMLLQRRGESPWVGYQHWTVHNINHLMHTYVSIGPPEQAMQCNLLFDPLSSAAKQAIMLSMTPLSIPAGTQVRVTACMT